MSNWNYMGWFLGLSNATRKPEECLFFENKISKSYVGQNLDKEMFLINSYVVLQAYSISRLIAVPSLMRMMLAAMESPYNIRIQSSLETLVLSGEVFPISLWEMLYKLLPKTTILNLYGSTEVRNLLSYF